MSKPFLAAFGLAVIIIAGLVWFGFMNTAGNHLAPTGKIGKVRTVKASDDLTYMVIDFKVTNNSDREMVVRSIDVTADAGDGLTGSLVSASDADAAFQAYPLLGERYNDALKVNDKIPAHQTVDRMVGVRFDAPFDKVESRKNVTLRIEDVTGPILEMSKQN